MITINKKIATILIRYAKDYGTPYRVENGKLVMFDNEEVRYEKD